MEEDRETTRYWCHACSRVVNPIVEVESIKCSVCQGGFMEEMHGGAAADHGVSLLAPILLGMINAPLHHRRARQTESNQENGDDGGGTAELDELLRRRRSSAAVLRLLQGIRAGLESENNEQEPGRVILINPFSQTIIVQGNNGGANPFDSSNSSQNPSQNHQFGDYFFGSGLEQLLQHLAENDPNRYGTPPAKKEAIEAMPSVWMKDDSIQCSVCLEEFGIDTEAREMPCKHLFHGDCILPWLELHSSCPVCRYQLPADESKINREPQGSSRGNFVNSSSGVTNNQERQLAIPLPWPLSNLFSGSNNVNSTSVSASDEADTEGNHRQEDDR